MVQVNLDNIEETEKIKKIIEKVPFVHNPTGAVRYALSKLKLEELEQFYD